jgi:hypothetical protein
MILPAHQDRLSSCPAAKAPICPLCVLSQPTEAPVSDSQDSSQYQPPQASRAVLGNIVELLQQAASIDPTPFGAHAATFIGILPGGALYFEVPTIDVDDDGSSDGCPDGWVAHPLRGGHLDPSHQDQVSYSTRPPISAFNVPYIVLPGGNPTWWRAQGIHIGDGAVVIRGDQRIVAVFADTGPGNKIGEMSIRAHQILGETVIVSGKKPRLGPDGKPITDPDTNAILSDPAPVTRNSASQRPFVVIVFPGTSLGASFVNVDASLHSAIEESFAALANRPTA